MKTFLITYDLRGEESRIDYTIFIQAIKDNFSLWAKPVESVWVVKSDKTALGIRDILKGFVDNNDRLVVFELSGGWASRNISNRVTDWFKKNI